MTIRRQDLAEKIKHKESVSHVLMAESYDPETRIFTLSDLSMGMAFDLKPIPTSDLSYDTLANISDSFASALKGIEPHSIIQTIIFPEADIEEDIAAYLRAGGDRQAVISRNQEMTIEQFRNSMEKPLYSMAFGEAVFKTRRYRVVMTLIIRPNRMVGGVGASGGDFIGDFLGKIGSLFQTKKQNDENDEQVSDVGLDPAERRFKGLREELTRKLLEASQSLVSGMRDRQVAVTVMDATKLINFTQRLLDLRRGPVQPDTWNPNVHISKQIAENDIAVEFSSGTVRSGKTTYKTVTLLDMPRTTSVGMLTRSQEQIGYASMLDYLGEGFICVAGSVRPTTEVRRELEVKKEKLDKGWVPPSKKEGQKKDVVLFLSLLDGKPPRIAMDVQVTFCVGGSDEQDVAERAKRVTDKLKTLGLDSRVEQHFGPSIFFQALPFGFAPTIKEARRFFLALDSFYTDLMPVYSVGRGTSGANVLLHNRLGEPFRISLFDGTAPHAIICGESGSGKSFFASYLMYGILREPKSQVFVFDKGSSFAVLANMLGGDAGYYNMSPKIKTCINPFAGTLTTSSSFLTGFIAHLASQTERDRLSQEQLGVVSEAIREAFIGKQKRETWQDYSELKNRYRVGAWIDKARKRLPIDPVDESRERQIQQLKEGGSGREPQFEIYRVAKLLGKTNFERGTQKILSEEEFDVCASINKNTRARLENRGFMVENHIGEDGAMWAAVLYEHENMERTLELDGFKFERQGGYLLLEVERPEDLRTLELQGVRVQIPSDYRQKARKAYETELSKQGITDQNYILEMAAKQTADMSALGYYDTIEGWCIIQYEVTFSDFIAALKEHRQEDVTREILPRLSPYYGDGPESGYFDGQTQYELSGKRLVGFELKELASAGPHLLAAVVGTIMQMLILYCQSENNDDGGPRAYRKAIFIDEAWELIDIPMVGGLIINAIKTMRKHNTAVVPITQRILELAESENGRKILTSVQHRFILKQDPGDIVRFADVLNWTPERLQLMATVHASRTRGLYSEVLVDIPSQNVFEVARFVPTPYFYWLATTAADDHNVRTAIQDGYRAQHSSYRSLTLALEECAKKYPHGTSFRG